MLAAEPFLTDDTQNALFFNRIDSAWARLDDLKNYLDGWEGAGFWAVHLVTGRIWLSSGVHEVLGELDDQAELMGIEGLLTRFVVEDANLARRLIHLASIDGQSFRIECRVNSPVEERTCRLEGRVLLDANGAPDTIFGVCTDTSERSRSIKALAIKQKEIDDLKLQFGIKDSLPSDRNTYVHEDSRIVGRSPAIRKIFEKIRHVATTDSIVLITGETGTGKEMIAHAIHSQSHRKKRMLVTVNCATLPATLVESELFGREKGAYTGALSRQTGRFELADGATIFLDEIGEMSLDLQSKLLRVVEQGEFERLGSSRTIRVNTRIIAATNRNLAEEVRRGNFRADLYYRLNVFPIQVPALRERVEDIPLLVGKFISEFSEKMGRPINSVPKQLLDWMMRQSWPGNVRELRNTIEAAMISSQGNKLELPMCRDENLSTTSKGMRLTLAEAERKFIMEAIESAGGRIKGRQGAAELLGIKPSTLFSKMQKMGIVALRKGTEYGTVDETSS